jgi:hypothetical protein
MASTASRITMYTLTTRPLVLAGAISDTYMGAVTVSTPAPKPLQIRAKSSKP